MTKKTTAGYKTHKFDVFDQCERCGIHRKKVPYVGDGIRNFAGKFDTYYSKDEINWQKEFINCESR